MTHSTTPRRSARLGVAALAASLVLASAATLSSAAPSTVDQAQELTDIGFVSGRTQVWAQTVTAGRSGMLDQVDLNARRYAPVETTVPLTVNIRRLVDGAPTGEVLSTSAVLLEVQLEDRIVPFILDTPVPVSTGDRFAIEVVTPTEHRVYIHLIQGVAEGDEYPGGEAWFGQEGQPPFISVNGVRDLWFRTYVSPWSFTGFEGPFGDAGSGQVNRVKAGASVPLRFSLDGDKGLDILATGSPRVELQACDGTGPVQSIETTTTANSGLRYNHLTDQYTYVWKTDKRWAGQCGTLQLGLTDGSLHTARFDFR